MLNPQIFINMLNILHVTLKHVKMAFLSVNRNSTREYHLMMPSSVKVFPTCVIFFLERNYPVSIVNHALDKVPSLSQDQAPKSPENSNDKSIIPFVVEYNPSLPKTGLIINTGICCNSHRRTALKCTCL